MSSRGIRKVANPGGQMRMAHRRLQNAPCYTGAVRRLVINADDFGLTSGINRAILEAHEHGVVTSATLMANGLEFADAVQRARQAPQLSVGCHVVLVDGTPVLEKDRIPSLVHRSGNAFRPSWAGFARATLSGKLVAQEIEEEATAQIRKLQQAGIPVTHLDTHKHTHMFPQVLRPLLRAAKACGIRAIRAPFEPPRLRHWVNRPNLWKRAVAARTLRRYASQFRRAVRDERMLAPEGSLGIVATGLLDEPLLARILEGIPEGTWELVCHPGYSDAALLRVPTRLRDSRARELQLLLSAATRDLLARKGIELVSYRAVAESQAL